MVFCISNVVARYAFYAFPHELQVIGSEMSLNCLNICDFGTPQCLQSVVFLPLGVLMPHFT